LPRPTPDPLPSPPDPLHAIHARTSEPDH
jgi:hypothetical protein